MDLTASSSPGCSVSSLPSLVCQSTSLPPSTQTWRISPNQHLLGQNQQGPSPPCWQPGGWAGIPGCSPAASLCAGNTAGSVWAAAIPVCRIITARHLPGNGDTCGTGNGSRETSPLLSKPGQTCCNSQPDRTLRGSTHGPAPALLPPLSLCQGHPDSRLTRSWGLDWGSFPCLCTFWCHFNGESLGPALHRAEAPRPEGTIPPSITSLCE